MTENSITHTVSAVTENSRICLCRKNI